MTSINTKVEIISLRERLIAGTAFAIFALIFFVVNHLTAGASNLWSPMRVAASILLTIGLLAYFGKFLEVYVHKEPAQLTMYKRPAFVTYLSGLLLFVSIFLFSF